jgi:hypothetical protein
MSDHLTAMRMAERLNSRYELHHTERDAMAKEFVRLARENAAMAARLKASERVVAPVVKQYRDLLFLMQDAWGIVHGRGDEALKAKWSTILRENGDHAKTPPVISREQNARIYEALEEGRDVVLGAWVSNTVRETYARVMDAHQSLKTPEGFVLAFPSGSEAEAAELVHALRLGGSSVYRVPAAEAAPALRCVIEASGIEPEIGG